jgi:SAM-dependent methyltransferase
MAVVNHFVHRTVAERYERNRPHFHPRVIALIRERLQLTRPLPRALDVGCGTGQSAVALRACAGRVFAADVSAAMLAVAPAVEGITYVRAPAENLPFGAGEFPLVTVGLAIHWFDRHRFLAEASRVLGPGGWLVIYGHHYTKKVAGCAEFANWCDEVYLRRYPPGPRHGEPVNAAELEAHGLRLRDRTGYTEMRPYTAETFADCLMTHSNVIKQVEDGDEPAAAVRAWLAAELRRLFGGEAAREVEFAGWITWVQKD